MMAYSKKYVKEAGDRVGLRGISHVSLIKASPCG